METTLSDDMAEMAPERDKAVRLFTYLKELCALRTTQVRNVASYDQLFWLCDLPRHKLCRCSLWRLVDPPSFGAEHQADPWIEIRKPTLRSPPELPDDVEPWIKDEQLSDSSLSEPGFYDQIPRLALQGDAGDGDPNALVSISEFPQVFDKWVDYVEVQWKPWAKEDRELQKVQKAYNRLFNIYQRQEKLGEQYEVIVGTGLLSWKSPNSGEIKRHILEIQARIEFDRVRGIMTAGPALDGPKPILECGMLETADRPNPTDLTEIESDALGLSGDPLEDVGLESVLRGFANSLPIAGEYSPSLDYTGSSSDKPTVKLAPTLILRKRTRRTFEDFYRQIIEQVKKGEDIPENILRIIDIVEESPSGDDPGSDTATECARPRSESDTELYFPLPANEEQKRIAQKIEHRRGVLVQGPPGTGKSHTIANLISHFLAQGKRILVTSETPRALEVLRSKLPREIEELCVVWLGSGPESHKALEKSVLGITQRKANWSSAREQSLIDENARRLDAERKEQAQLGHELRACREADVYCHSDIFGRYSGTLQEIAIQINQERGRFQWFTDRPRKAFDPAVRCDELLRMAQTHRSFTPDLIEQLKLELFPIEQLIRPSEFRRYVESEQRAHAAHQEAHDNRSYPGYAQLSALDRAKRDSIKAMIEGVLATQDALAKHFQSWADRLSREVAGDHDRVWRHILSATAEHVERIEALLTEHGKLDAVGLHGKDHRLVLEHIEALRAHLQAGGKLGFWIFRAQIVKDALYLVQSVKVNGKLCRDIGTLNELAAWINMSTRIDALGDLWKGITTPPTGDAVLQCSAYRDLCEPIEQALALHERIQKVRETCGACPGVRLPAWHSQDEVKAFDKAIDASNLEDDFAGAQRFFKPLAESLRDHINSGHSHATTEQLLQAVISRDGGLYQEAFGGLSSMHACASDYKLSQNIHQRFHACAPRACESYDESYAESMWDERFAAFDAAWVWAKTDSWLDEINDKERPKLIQRALENSTIRERGALKSLAASKAWHHCMTNLREKERMALIAWSQAVAKIRSGTGKYAETHRETARQKLDECRRAIPAWVMPLYQVVQTTRPTRHQFDVVIIDEASQSGPEALLLNYIADKLIVVGDDKQITPMHVGVDRAAVAFLQRKHLKDIPHPQALDLEGSLFSQAELRFPDRVRLREHFRCMPEIIQFSNNLSYTTEPLIPLRQYGADRLEPLRTTFVKDGYRKGSSDDIENPPEAEAIVAQIAECCENLSYAGKTFGVICLKGGNRQADLITNLLVKEIGAEEMERRRIVCGRAYDFQGDERDVIFLDLVDALSDGIIRSDMSNPDVQRRYNVAASRARDQLWVFHSMSLNDLRPGSYQYRLLEYCQNPTVRAQGLPFDVAELGKQRRDVRPPEPFESWFEVDVFLQIHARGFRALPQYEIAAYRIDLVVEGLKGRLAVECDGDKWHGPDRYESDMARQRDLERCGWVFWRVRGSDFYRDVTAALDELWQTLERSKISPCHAWEPDRQDSETDSTAGQRGSESNGAEEDQVISEEDQEDKPAEDQQEFLSASQTHGRLDRALEYIRSKRRRPEDLPPLDIQDAIVQVLQKCPGHTCTLKSLTSRVSKELGVLTRGNPRLEFEKRVMRNLGALKRKGLIEEYKAKNKRVRLLALRQENLLFR
jgi:very-short-patch-repair endonuclease